MTAAVIVGGRLVDEKLCPHDVPLRESIGELVREAAESAQDTEVWLLLHDHPYVDDEDPCDCDKYLSLHPTPFATFNRAEAPA